jgi:hypothetical protein
MTFETFRPDFPRLHNRGVSINTVEKGLKGEVAGLDVFHLGNLIGLRLQESKECQQVMTGLERRRGRVQMSNS